MIMNKNLRLFSLFVGIFLLISLTNCTTSKSVVSQGVNLSKYKYVAIIDNDTYRIPPKLMQYQIQLYDAIEQSGLKLINQYRVNGLTRNEQSTLLIATFGVSVSQEETVVTVNFIDFDSGRPLVSCRGAYTTLGISQSADIKGALKRVGEQISKTFK